MNHQTLDLILVLVTAAMAVITAVTSIFVFRTLREYQKLSYLQFYEIIVRHHSPEQTELRRTVRRNLERKVEEAKKG